MKLFGFNIQVSRSPAPTLQRSFTPEQWLRGEDLDNPSSTLSNAYQQVVWVYRAINVLAEAVANIPFLFSAGERGRESLITSGPLLDFYNHPGPHMNRFQYWELRVIWLMLRGECFRVPIYSDSSSASASSSSSSSTSDFRRQTLDSSRPSTSDFRLQTSDSGLSRSHAPRSSRRLSRVLFLDPSRCQHIVENHELIGWRYTGFGHETPLPSQVFLPEEVWFEKLPNPFDHWRGMPPLYVAESAAKADFAASAFMRGIIENNADVGLIVRSDDQLDEEQREQVRATLRDRKRKAGTADKPMYLWGVNEIIRPQLSSADLQFLDNRKFSRSEICAAFGVPEEIITTTDKAKYDVMEGARLNFIENRIAPLCARLEAEENATIIPALAASIGADSTSQSALRIPHSALRNIVGWFDTDSLPIMQEAQRKRLAAVKAGFDMGIPFNELNRVFDLGFKPLPWGDTGFVKSNLKPLGSTKSSSSSSSSSSSQS